MDIIQMQKEIEKTLNGYIAMCAKWLNEFNESMYPMVVQNCDFILALSTFGKAVDLLESHQYNTIKMTRDEILEELAKRNYFGGR